MDWNDFFKSVKEQRWESVYLFTGPEELTKKEALAAMRKAILPAGLEQLNEVILEGVSAQAIIDAAETLPVMCERRIVVVRNWAPLLGGKARNEDQQDAERILEWLKNPPDSCILLFYNNVEIDGRKKLSTALKKMPGFVEFNYLSGASLAKWCVQQLKPFGKKISADAVNEMTLMAGQDLNRLSGELKKLTAFTEDRPEITIADIRAVVSPSPEYSVFMILDHLLEGRIAEATQVVNSVLQVDNPIRVIALLSSQLRINAHMKYAIEAKTPTAEVCKALNINEYRARHIQRQIRSIPANTLRSHYEACVDADFAIKSGKMKDRAALDALMLKIAGN